MPIDRIAAGMPIRKLFTATGFEFTMALTLILHQNSGISDNFLYISQNHNHQYLEVKVVRVNF